MDDFRLTETTGSVRPITLYRAETANEWNNPMGDMLTAARTETEAGAIAGKRPYEPTKGMMVNMGDSQLSGRLAGMLRVRRSAHAQGYAPEYLRAVHADFTRLHDRLAQQEDSRK